MPPQNHFGIGSSSAFKVFRKHPAHEARDPPKNDPLASEQDQLSKRKQDLLNKIHLLYDISIEVSYPSDPPFLVVDPIMQAESDIRTAVRSKRDLTSDSNSGTDNVALKAETAHMMRLPQELRDGIFRYILLFPGSVLFPIGHYKANCSRRVGDFGRYLWRTHELPERQRFLRRQQLEPAIGPMTAFDNHQFKCLSIPLLFTSKAILSQASHILITENEILIPRYLQYAYHYRSEKDFPHLTRGYMYRRQLDIVSKARSLTIYSVSLRDVECFVRTLVQRTNLRKIVFSFRYIPSGEESVSLRQAKYWISKLAQIKVSEHAEIKWVAAGYFLGSDEEAEYAEWVKKVENAMVRSDVQDSLPTGKKRKRTIKDVVDDKEKLKEKDEQSRS
jgi:hypothetical protein